MPKIKAPNYVAKNKQPHILKLVDDSKSKAMIKKINNADITDEEKQFLIKAAYRHNKFNYAVIADYYCHASVEMQELMEQSALVIIDSDKAIENGFMKFTNSMAKLVKNG